MALDPAKSYSLLELVTKKVFPGRKSYNAVKALVMAEAKTLKPQVFGEGRATRIYIKGADIIKFLEK